MTPPDAGTIFVLLVRVTAILAMAWVVSRSRWGTSAAVRHALWVSALGAALLVPVLGSWLPSIHLPLPPGLSEPATVPSGQLLSPLGSEPTPASSGSGTPAVESPPVVSPGPGDRSSEASWRSLFVAVWIGGALLRLVWLAMLHIRTRRLTNGARSLRVHSRVQLLSAEAARLLGIRYGVQVLTSPEVRMPLAWGVLRPVVLLPTDALHWSEERLRVVLLHELAHVRRRDYATALLSELVCVLYWPTPLVWVARRNLRIEQEQACDDRVLALGTPPLAYADHLLAIARDFYGSRCDLEVVVTMAREVSLKRRVRAILDEGTDRRPFRSGRGLVLSAAVLVLYLPIAAVRGSPAEAIERSAASATPLLPPTAGAPALGAPVYLWIEAEDGVGAGAFPGGDLDASHAEYILLDPTASRTAALRVETTLTSSGEYVIWARAAPADRGRSTIGMTIAGEGTRWVGVADLDAGGKHGDWEWVRLNPTSAGRPADGSGAVLPAGRYSFELLSADDEVRVDRLLLTTDASYTPTAKGPGTSSTPAYLLIEAEDGTRTGRVHTAGDSHASGSSFLIFRERHGTAVDGSVDFGINVPHAGRYLIWGRTYAKNEKSNSFHVSVNGAPEVVWDIPADDGHDDERDWSWDPVSARDSLRMDPLPFDMEAGSHILRIRTREGGALLDALLVTNDLDNRPEGLWPEALPARPTRVELSPERATLTGPIAVAGTDDGRPYLLVQGTGRAKAPGRSGFASFEFEAIEKGLYSVWARTVAPSTDQDSFWIRVDGGDWVLWNGIPKSSEWIWAPVRDAEADGRLLQLRLEPGPHTLEIAGREAGLRLDRLLVTNDPLFNPS